MPQWPASQPSPRDYDLFVRALGRTEVWARGHLIEDWASNRGLAILRYLLLQHPTAVHRERLMDLLWPRSSARAARNNLNVAIHGLRRSLEAGGPGPYVVFKNGSYSLDRALTTWIDFEAFARERDLAHESHRAGDEDLARQRFRRVASLYGGELFADDHRSDWPISARRLLADRFAEALEVVATHDFDNDDLVSCIDNCVRLLEVDPCRESIHRLLMRAYAAEGHHHLAARQYATCVAKLADELDASPQPETTATFLDVLRLAPEAGRNTRPAGPTL